LKLNNVNLSNENIVLLATCRPGGASALNCLTRVLNQNKIDWENLFFKASFHRVLPAVYNNLAQFYKELVPEKYLEKFRNEYIEISKKSLFLSSALIDLVSKLDNSGIKSASFKGPTLSYLLHHDISMRDFSDLDILIKKSDLEEVRQLLRSSGYIEQFELNEHYKVFYENSVYYYLNFAREDGKVILDVHWSTNAPNYSFSGNYECYENRIQEIEFLNCNVPALGREDMLLELSIHWAKHSWCKLGWICDIGELCNPVHGVDIKSVINRSVELKCSGIVCNALLIADILFDCVDSSIVNHIRSKLRDNIGSQYFISMIFPEYGLVSDIRKNLFFPLSMDSYRDKIIYFYINYICPTPLEFSIVKINCRLFFLYYPLRILRLCYRFLWRLLVS